MNRANPLPASAHHDTMAYAASITRLDTVHPSPSPHDMINRGPLLSPTNDNRPENGGKRRGGGALLLRDETEICLLFFPVFFCFFFFFFLHVFKEKNKGISERSETKICSSSFVTYFQCSFLLDCLIDCVNNVKIFIIFYSISFKQIFSDL